MPIRTGMTDIVALLRQYGQAATNDVFDGVTYWTDEQLEAIADRNGRRVLIKIKRTDPAYTIYRVIAPNTIRLEDDLAVYTADEVAVATSFTYNSNTNELVFTTALTDEVYYAYGLVVDVYAALAELWENKASQRFNYIDWKAQNNKMNMAQEYQHCLDRAAYYRNKRIRTFTRDGRGRWYS